MGQSDARLTIGERAVEQVGATTRSLPKARPQGQRVSSERSICDSIALASLGSTEAKEYSNPDHWDAYRSGSREARRAQFPGLWWLRRLQRNRGRTILPVDGKPIDGRSSLAVRSRGEPSVSGKVSRWLRCTGKLLHDSPSQEPTEGQCCHRPWRCPQHWRR